jgi:hypothetical protein
MAKLKQNTYINTELDWAEVQLSTWKKYIDANPVHELKDRVEFKPTARGGVIPMVIASIEQQLKAISDLMKNYLTLLEVVDKLREKEEKRLETRGDAEVNRMMMEQLKSKE